MGNSYAGGVSHPSLRDGKTALILICFTQRRISKGGAHA